MKCAFYRPKNANLQEWSSILNQLRADLYELETGKVPEKEVRQYLEELFSLSQPLESNPSMSFWGFDNPDNMPGEAIVDFIFWPTYVASIFAMTASRIYPGILKRVDSGENILRACLRGCAADGFHGIGYDALQGLVEIMEFFVEHKVHLFLHQAGDDFCPEFHKAFSDTLSSLYNELSKGSVMGTWGEDYTDRSRNIIYSVGRDSFTESQGVLRLYAAYGSNLNILRMKKRCPQAYIVGTSELKDWRLMFKGSKTGNYLTVEPAEGFSVPIALWAISAHDEAMLDRYEGFPTFYYKKKLNLTLNEDLWLKKQALFYIMHEERQLGMPDQGYVDICLDGYNSFGFDPQHIEEALKISCR